MSSISAIFLNRADPTSTGNQPSSADGSTSDADLTQLLINCLNDVMGGGPKPKVLERSSPTSSDDSQPTSSGSQPTATNSAQPASTDGSQSSSNAYYPPISGAGGSDIKNDKAIGDLMKADPNAAESFMNCFTKDGGGGDAAAKKLTGLINSGSISQDLGKQLALEINPLAKANGFGTVQNAGIQGDLAKATGGTDYLQKAGSPWGGL